MYSVRQIKKAFKNPSLFLSEVNRRYNRWLNSRHGIDFLSEDWDNLVLLDGCRYDLFENENFIDGELSPIKSNSSSSDEFFEKNIEGGEFGDLVYYSGNPHIDNVDAKFYDLYRLWETDWNEENGTVMPGDAVERVLKTKHKYRDKRIILHMMQPHRPFLGEAAMDFNQSPFSRRGVNIGNDEDPEIPFWWQRMRRGELSKEEVYPMYRATLQVALPHVQKLVNNISGKTVISADHANLFGEDGLFGHPSYTHHKDLITVPWLEIEKERKSIVTESATEESKQEHFDDATDRLKALGYL